MIMQRYSQRLYRVARGVVRDDGEAEDVVQEAYVRAYAALGDFRGEAGLATWLTRIVLNEALGRLCACVRPRSSMCSMPFLMRLASSCSREWTLWVIRKQLR